MNREDFTEFSGSLTFNTIKFNHDAIPKPDTLVICMTRGEHRIADELSKRFGGFERVIIDVDGEQYEFNADSFIGLLESYEDAAFDRGECERVKHGTKPDGTPRYRCSVCGYGLGDYRWAYCPKCGYRIRGER